VDFATGANSYFVVIDDIDGDGKPEIVVSNVSSVISVLHNTSTTGSINASSFTAKVDFTVGFHPVTVAIGDLDGDGKRDLVLLINCRIIYQYCAILPLQAVSMHLLLPLKLILLQITNLFLLLSAIWMEMEFLKLQQLILIRIGFLFFK
jgi:hypothetical protein